MAKIFTFVLLLVSCAFAAPTPTPQRASATTVSMTFPGEEQTIAAEWMSGGIKIVVTTPKKQGEGNANWMQRHKLAVEQAKIDFPPDAQMTGGPWSGWVPTQGTVLGHLSTWWVDGSGLVETVNSTPGHAEPYGVLAQHHKSAVASAKMTLG